MDTTQMRTKYLPHHFKRLGNLFIEKDIMDLSPLTVA